MGFSLNHVARAGGGGGGGGGQEEFLPQILVWGASGSTH